MPAPALFPPELVGDATERQGQTTTGPENSAYCLLPVFFAPARPAASAWIVHGGWKTAVVVMDQRNARDTVIPISVAAFWGSAFVAIKAALEYFTPDQVVALRFGVAALGFLLLYRFGAIKWKRIERSDLPRFAAVVGSGLLAYHSCLARAEAYVSASLAALVSQLAPVIVVVVATLLKKKLPRLVNALGIVLAGAGATLLIISSPDFDAARVGLATIALTLAPPIALAAFTIWSEPLVKAYGAENVTAQAIIVAAVVFIVVAWANGVNAPNLANAPVGAWVAVASLATLSTVAGYTLWFKAIERSGAASVSPYLYLVPVFAVATAVGFLGEVATWQTLGSGLLVLVGVALGSSTSTEPQGQGHGEGSVTIEVNGDVAGP